jgi:hypothetical protein
MSSFMCLYHGRPGECLECGGHVDDPEGRFCTQACEDSYDANLATLEARAQQRRDAEDAYGRMVTNLRAEGLTYDEIDRRLAGHP